MADFRDLVAYALTSLRHRQLRAYLTVLGIVIGIAAIVSLVSVGDGLSASINDQLKQFGARNVVVVPGDINKQITFSGGPNRPPAQGKLFENDMQRIEKVAGVYAVNKAIQTRAAISFKDKNGRLSVNGVEPVVFSTVQVLNISSGRFLADNERRTAVVGWSFADGSVFDKAPMGVGSVFRLGDENLTYRVVGILAKMGRMDSVIYIPFEDAKELASTSLADKEVTAIRYSILDGYNMSEVNDAVESELAAAHRKKIDEKDFSLVTSESIMRSIGVITTLVTAFLGFVASIALVVGGVGVANTMFMSVMERTKEIGTLKAIGGSNMDVFQLVLIESAIIGLVGGALGVALGAIISEGINIAGAESGFYTVITPYIVAFAMAFSVGVGLVSGFFPAKQAADLSPMVAMRME